MGKFKCGVCGKRTEANEAMECCGFRMEKSRK